MRLPRISLTWLALLLLRIDNGLSAQSVQEPPGTILNQALDINDASSSSSGPNELPGAAVARIGNLDSVGFHDIASGVPNGMG